MWSAIVAATEVIRSANVALHLVCICIAVGPNIWPKTDENDVGGDWSFNVVVGWLIKLFWANGCLK